MANTSVLLLKPIPGLGNEGEQVSVKAGYARNYLLPRKLALPQTHANRKQIDALVKAREARQAKELNDAQSLAQKLGNLSLAIAVKTGESGKLFGAVTTQHIAERLANEGIEIEKKRIHLLHPIKELGQHTASIKLHSDVVVEIKIEVVSENPIEETAKA